MFLRDTEDSSCPRLSGNRTQVHRQPQPGRARTLTGDGLGVGLLAFLTGTAGDQLVEGDWDWTGDGGAGGFLAAGSGDPETDREDDTLLTD